MLPFLTNDSRARFPRCRRCVFCSARSARLLSRSPLCRWLARAGEGNQQHGFFYTAVVFGVIATFSLLVS